MRVSGMIKWSVSTEVFSLIVLFILILNFYERRWDQFPQRKMQRVCMLMSAGTILLNILCTYFISLAEIIPMWINMLCNSAYFLLIMGVSTVIAAYLCHLLYEHIYSMDGIQNYLRFLAALYLIYVVLIIFNLWSGVIFYFDEDLNYQRGPLINTGYIIMFLQLLVLIMIAFYNWRSINLSMRKVMHILPSIILALTVYQFFYPNVMLNGGIIAAVNIILLFNFESRRVEQDILTPVGNRGSLHQELMMRVSGMQQFQVVALSLQQYRAVNQRYGVKRGDALLYSIAAWLEQMHPKGKAFRMGNVEFALLVPYNGPRAAEDLLKKMKARFQESWNLENVEITIHAALAEFIYTGQDRSADDILELLNFSLSLAKTGREPVIRYDPSLDAKMALVSQTMKLLQKAIREDLFEAWYQPVYHCSTGRFAMAEALVRMRDNHGNLIPPAIFIPIAESNGLIEDITFIMLEHACRLLTDPAANGLKSISVNLSAQQLMSDRLIRKLDELQERYPFDPQRLRLEVTERVLLEDFPEMHSIMSDLMDRGFGFSLDDFGTGQSNLCMILKNSFSCIKLDRSLILEYPGSERSSYIVNTTLDMFHNLNCELIVEGVETQVQAQALIEHGVEWIQGFYYAKPMPVEAFLDFLAANGESCPSLEP